MTVRDYLIKYGIAIRPFDGKYMAFEDSMVKSAESFKCFCLEDVIEVSGDSVWVPVYKAIVVDQRIEKVEKYNEYCKRNLKPYLKEKLQESSMGKLNFPGLAR